MNQDYKFTTKLPDKLSELIRVALADFEKVEGDKGYVLDMCEWHTYHEAEGVPRAFDNKCSVCLAGSVLAKTCGYPISGGFNPWLIIDRPTRDEMADDTAKKLIALNWVRTGDFRNAFYRMSDGLLWSPERYGFAFCDSIAVISAHLNANRYAENRAEFKRWLAAAADLLASVGL